VAPRSMVLRAAIAAVLGICLTLAACPNANAAWPHDPNVNVPLCTFSSDQVGPVICSDGAGGAIVAWEDSRAGNTDIYAQRVNAAGVPVWTTDGVAICIAASSQFTPAIVPDGAGGAIITWADSRNGSTQDIYAQRVNSAGVVQWAANGVPICLAANIQQNPKLASDGAGGAIITWWDARAGTNADIYAQRVSPSGTPLWLTDGVVVCNAINNQFYPTIVTDGAGGAIITWQDGRNGPDDVYAQRVNGSGVAQWTANGVVISAAASNQDTPVIASDGAGGAFIAWQDLRSLSTNDVYAQRVNSAGTVLWTTDGVPVCTAPNNQQRIVIAADGFGGALIAWDDNRNPSFDVYAQRVNPSGTMAWTLNGVAVSTAASDQQSPTVISDGAGGAIIAWNDLRGTISYDIYAQRVNASGVPQWTTDGVAVCTAALSQNLPMAVADGAGGAIITWYDSRSGTGTNDIYAQRIEHYGQLGNPEPSIVNVKDYPNDQGGKVRIEWNASYLDADPYRLIASYNIWRQAPPFIAESAVRAGTARLLADGEGPVDSPRLLSSPRTLYRVAPNSTQTYYWEFVANQIAQQFPGYSYVAATGSDSVGAGNPYTRFMIEALGNNNPQGTWSSAPDSGYSVDNLPPVIPAPFTAAYAAGATHLHWGENTDADLAGYRLYRGTSSGFVPSSGNLISAQPDTGYADPGGAGGWYKLSAIDTHGNESAYAILGPNGTLDAPNVGVTALAFSPPSPNPVRGDGASFVIALPQPADVTLSLFDSQGRHVRELARGTLAAGEHRARWDGRDDAGRAAPSGIYFARLEALGRTLNTRFAVVR
jgi:hypothetical protein